jgi:membrane-associated phospholipid phosphatase
MSRDRLSTAVAWTAFGVCVLAARSRRVGRAEESVMLEVNELPDDLNAPLWTVMQLGALASPLVCGAVATVAGRPDLGRRLVASGVGAYLLAKVIKRSVGRARPDDLVTGIHVRGKPANGGGFVSGHAAVSAAIGMEAYLSLGRRALPLAYVVAPLVGFSRVYVGAHLPLDVLGGTTFGWAFGATIHRVAARGDAVNIA